MSEFQITKATRQGIKPLIGLYGKSGGGKTRSALMLARGIVGPNGRTLLVDTENRRGSIFADKIPGGYNVINLDAPFSPERYTKAIEAAEKESDIIIIDSMTHEWDGDGGVIWLQGEELDRMAGDDFKKREACKMAAWVKPKTAHKFFVQRILRSPLPIICCLRAQEKTHMVKEEGKTKVVTDKFSTPIYDSRFVFEMLINGEVYEQDGIGGFVHVTKITHEDLFECLPKEGEQLSIKHGELLAKWCASAGAPNPPPAASAAKSPLERLKLSKLWSLTESIHGGEVAKLQKWLVDNDVIKGREDLLELPTDRLVAIKATVEAKLAQPAQT